jgi:hypothetical protein
LVHPVSGSELLDLAGPWSVLGYTNEVIGREVYMLRLISPLGGDTPTRHGLVFTDAQALNDSSPEPPDVVVIAGGATVHPLPSSEARGKMAS